MSQSNHSSKCPLNTKLYSPDLFLILAVQGCFGISYAAFLLLPKFLRIELGASATEIGWMSGVALVASAAFSPFVGFLSRRLGRRALLMSSLVLEGGGAVLFSVIEEIGALAYLIRIAQGCAFVMVFNCTTTMVAELVPKRHLARAIGYVGLSMLLSNAIAPLVTEPLAETFGWGIAFSLSGLAALCALLLLPFLSQFDQPVHTEKATPRLTRALPVYYASCVTGVGLGVMFTFVQPFALAQGATRVGQFFLGYVLAAASSRTIFSGLTDRLGPYKMAKIALTSYAAVTLVSSQLTPQLLVVLGAGLGLSHGFLYPALSAMGLAQTPSSARSHFMGWFFCAFNLGFAIAVLLLGPFADRFGYPSLFLIAGTWVLSGTFALSYTSEKARLVSR